MNDIPVSHPNIPASNALVEKYSLLIGLDTEYTTNAKALKHGKNVARDTDANFVISYQIYALATSTGEVRSIVLYTDGKRLDIATLANHAVNLFSTTHFQVTDRKTDGGPNRQRICFVTHFGVAEWAVLADRQLLVEAESADEHQEYALNDLRKTPQVRGGYFQCNMLTDTLFYDWIDTSPLAPAGKQSLAALGELVDVPKVDIGLYNKSDMLQLLKEDPDLFYRYALTDSEITLKYIVYISTLTRQDLGMKDVIPATLGMLGVAQFQHQIKNHSSLGEDYGEYARRFGFVRPERRVKGVKNMPSELRLQHEPAFASSFYGGYNIAFMHCAITASQSEIIADIDLGGAYPAAMSVIAVPDFFSPGSGTKLTLDNIIDVVARRFIHKTSDSRLMELLTPSYVKCTFKFPLDCKYPCLPVSAEVYGLCYPQAGESICSGLEAVQALKMGAVLEIIDGFAYDPLLVQRNDVLQVIPVFADALHYTAIARSKTEPKTLLNLLWKEIRNSLYGKLAQGLKGQNITDIRGQSEQMSQSQLTNAAYAQTVTAIVRCALIAMVDAADKHGAVVTCATTDGFGCVIPVKREVRNSILAVGSNKEAVKQFKPSTVNGEFFNMLSELPEVSLMRRGLEHQSLDPDGVLEIKSFGDYAHIAKTRGYLMKLGDEYTQISTCGISINKSNGDSVRGLTFEEYLHSDFEVEHESTSLTSLKKIALGQASDLIRVDLARMTNTAWDWKRNISADGKTTSPWQTVGQMFKARDIESNIKARLKPDAEGRRRKIPNNRILNAMSGLRTNGSVTLTWARVLYRLIKRGDIKLAKPLDKPQIVARLTQIGVEGLKTSTLSNAGRKTVTELIPQLPDTSEARAFVDQCLTSLMATTDMDESWFAPSQHVDDVKATRLKNRFTFKRR